MNTTWTTPGESWQSGWLAGLRADATVRSGGTRRSETRAPSGTMTLVSGILAESADERSAIATVVREQLQRYGGFEVALREGRLLAGFGGAGRALTCALEIQRSVARRGAEGRPGESPPRIGLHVGEAASAGQRFSGTPVLIATQIALQARHGEILVSALVRELLAGSGDFRFDDGREITLEGMAKPQRLLGVIWDGAPRTEAPATWEWLRSARSPRRSRETAGGGSRTLTDGCPSRGF